MNKAEARISFSQQRQNLSISDAIKLDDLLLIQCQKLDWSNIQVLGSFYPSEKHKEPNSLLLVQFLKHFIPNLVVAYPVIEPMSSSMQFYEETPEMNINQWGIGEPIPNQLLIREQIDAFLVPLLGFDLIGHRVGFGKGYYDSYFQNGLQSVNRVGISYLEPIAKFQDTNEFDVPLTHCITPWKCYEFK